MLTEPRTPHLGISIRSAIPLGAAFEDLVRTQLTRQLRHEHGLVERATVRFEDVNGPKGGVDKICRIKLVLTGRGSLILEKLDMTFGQAFARAVGAIGIAARRVRTKRSSR